MKTLIAGGSGFIGSALRGQLEQSGHQVRVLTRRPSRSESELQWDGRSVGGWSKVLDETDAVVNLTGYGLEHWPWSAAHKQRFVDSRVQPGSALTAAIAAAHHRPRVLLQQSGINFYGARGAGVADESSAAGNDFLARLTVQWESATQPVEELGVRRVVARSAVVFDAHGGLFPLMALPVRLGVGGRLGGGQQAVPWIHLQDEVRALCFLLESDEAHGAYNLIAPQPTSNEAFMRAVAHALRRPYWFPTPAFLLRLTLGEMSTLVLDGRYSLPKRLLEAGFEFRYPALDAALGNLFSSQGV